MRKPFRRTAAIAALVLALSGMTAVAANAKSDKDTEKAAAADETSDTTASPTAASSFSQHSAVHIRTLLPRE